MNINCAVLPAVLVVRHSLICSDWKIMQPLHFHTVTCTSFNLFSPDRVVFEEGPFCRGAPFYTISLVCHLAGWTIISKLLDVQISEWILVYCRDCSKSLTWLLYDTCMARRIALFGAACDFKPWIYLLCMNEVIQIALWNYLPPDTSIFCFNNVSTHPANLVYILSQVAATFFGSPPHTISVSQPTSLIQFVIAKRERVKKAPSERHLKNRQDRLFLSW